MTPAVILAEAFLSEFHGARPGLTTKAFSQLPVQLDGKPYPSSYAALASIVPDKDQPVAVLDLACGDGFLLSLLASRNQPNLSLTGIDLSPAELALAACRLAGAAELTNGRAQELPYPSACFDYALCHMALMLMGEAEEVISEVHRVLKRRGTLAAVVGVAGSSSDVWSAYAEALSGYARQPRWSGMRLIDGRMRSPQEINHLLSPMFACFSSEEMHCTQRLSIDELWCWFEDMYDLYLLREEDWPAIRARFAASARTLCAADGRIELRQTLSLVKATAT